MDHLGFLGLLFLTGILSISATSGNPFCSPKWDPSLRSCKNPKESPKPEFCRPKNCFKEKTNTPGRRGITIRYKAAHNGVCASQKVYFEEYCDFPPGFHNMNLACEEISTIMNTKCDGKAPFRLEFKINVRADRQKNTCVSNTEVVRHSCGPTTPMQRLTTATANRPQPLPSSPPPLQFESWLQISNKIIACAPLTFTTEYRGCESKARNGHLKRIIRVRRKNSQKQCKNFALEAEIYCLPKPSKCPPEEKSRCEDGIIRIISYQRVGPQCQPLFKLDSC